jgi:glycosyltransferase involved in cell wall biosynthesis
MTKLRISCGIPVYNQASTIEQTIVSVLNQQDPFDEVVVIENHSTDGTAEILKIFGDKIKIITPPFHNGIAQNWNFCIDRLSNNWFSLLSGDDLLKPGFVANVKAAITACPHAALVRTDWDLINDQGVLLHSHHQYSVARVSPPPQNWQEQLSGPKVSFAAFATRKDLWEQVGGFPLDFHLFHDWMFWLKLAPFGPFIRVPKSLAQYRVQERPDIDKNRVVLRLFDEFHYVMDVLPLLPWTISNPATKIGQVRVNKLIELLNFLGRYPELIDKECATKLAIWADSVGMTTTYQHWLINRLPIKEKLPQRVILSIKKIIRKALVLRELAHTRK